MKLCKLRLSSGKTAVGSIEGDASSAAVRPLRAEADARMSLFDIFEAPNPAAAVQAMVDRSIPAIPLAQATLAAPIDRQEVWAAGVTYIRSRTARMEESVGAASFYDKVYEASRPELFFKATPHRVSGPGEPVRIRQDAAWNVPEPELALVLNSRLQLVGFTAGNDMSSRDIEGENPLYLPQAKLYNQCCGLGPCITLAEAMPPREQTGIRLTIRRGTRIAFEGATSAARIARSWENLIDYLGRDNSFPHGAFLLTGTGIVPEDSFTLQAGDLVSISIDGIGTLTNPVVQG